MDNCKPQCIDQLELLAQLAAKVDYLYQFYRSLSLSDLTDVENCLAPLKDQHLVFNGEVWNAENQKEVTLTVEPLIDSGVAIANITFNGDTTTIYCKDGTRVEVTPKPISGDKMPIADITVDGVPATIYSKDFTGDITNIIKYITEINNIIENLHPTEVTVQADYATGTKVATITVNNQPTDIKIPTATNVQVNAVDIPDGTTIATITVDGTPTTIKAPSGGGGGSNFDVSRIKAGNYITLTYLDQNEQEVQSPQDAYYVKIDANLSAIEETISQWERVVANALARHEQAIQELQNS